MVSIYGSVGFGGVNNKEDVLTIQKAFNRLGTLPSLVEDGLCGPKTIQAIRDFQSGFMEAPDGRIDTDGRTIKEINKQLEGTPEVKKIPKPVESEWEGDSSRWPQEKKLESLNREFREKMSEVVKNLKNRGFKPHIVYAWRSTAVQAELVRQGRSQVSFSFHNAQRPDGTPNALAADVIDKRWGWDVAAEANGFWEALGEAAKFYGLYWGGDWAGFKDVAHVQFLPNSELKRVKRESGVA